MKISQAAVFEPKKVERDRLVAGLKKAGLKVSGAESAQALRKEGVVVFGPSVAGAAKLARAVREAAPDALVLAAMKRVGKAGWADGVLPLPLSAPDLKVRLPELARLRSAALDASAPTHRPGEGILDPLTGFYTFAHFKEVLFVEVKRARRYNFALSLALIGFDAEALPRQGELRDKLLSGLALAIRRSLRDTDLAVQYSPERVILLMPHTDLQGALVVTRRICDRVARATLQHGDEVLRPTISAGVSGAGAASGEFSFGELVKHAQQALERAAIAGGNRVEFSVPDPVEGTPPQDAAL